MAHRGQATQGQISAVGVPVKGETEDRVDYFLLDQGGDNWVIFNLRGQRVCGGICTLECACEQGICKSHKTACHGIAKPVGVVDQSHLLVIDCESSNSDVLVAQNARQKLAIAILNIEVLIFD